VARLQDQDWDKIQLTPDLLRELETVDMMLDDTSAILVVDADGKTRATNIHSMTKAARISLRSALTVPLASISSLSTFLSRVGRTGQDLSRPKRGMIDKVRLPH
jgi:hypothetical protein